MVTDDQFQELRSRVAAIESAVIAIIGVSPRRESYLVAMEGMRPPAQDTENVVELHPALNLREQEEFRALASFAQRIRKICEQADAPEPG